MCGFVGIVSTDPERPAGQRDLERMLSPIRYRGPDGTGFLTEGPVGFGFCRLAIIDPEGGDQPLTDVTGQVTIVFNGEIYNFRELREILRSSGHRFVSDCDTEVITNAWLEWGEDCVHRLRGIFAFAIFDRRRHTVFLARDRSGIKPLVLSIRDHEIRFASESKALLAEPELREGVDPLGYIGAPDPSAPLPRTPFKGIVELGAGRSMTIEAGRYTVRRWWEYQPTEEEDDDRTLPEIVSQFQQTLHDAVGSQLVADVPIAASLSGGIDSSAVVASMVLHGRKDVTCYSVGFGEDHPDRHAAKLVAEHLGVPLRHISLSDQGASGNLIRYGAWISEGEFDSGFIGRIALSRAVWADGAKVLLSGQGIDEILTGYYPSYGQFRRETLYHVIATDVMRSWQGWPELSGNAATRAGLELFGSGGWGKTTATRLRMEHDFLRHRLLRMEDRTGMASHVEVRVPLLDHHLLELCCSIPEAKRAVLFDQKRVLRSAAAAVLPPQIVTRRKYGFNAGAPSLSTIAAAIDPAMIRALISPERIESTGIFEWRVVKDMIRGGDSLALDHVLVVQLLDELFIRNYEPEQFATPPDIPLVT